MRLACFAIALFSLALPAVFAKAGVEKGSAHSMVESVIRHLLEAQHFAGGTVQELLLAVPEGASSQPVYLVEFAVKRSGRLIRCEDWRFTVRRVPEGWAVLKTERGRCND